jgi:hypothetical protein
MSNDVALSNTLPTRETECTDDNIYTLSIGIAVVMLNTEGINETDLLRKDAILAAAKIARYSPHRCSRNPNDMLILATEMLAGASQAGK